MTVAQQSANQESWQERCTKKLLECVAQGGAAVWANEKRALSQTARVIIADAKLSAADLRDFDFSRCYIVRTDFSRARLIGSNFRQAIFRNVSFTAADVRGADFTEADATGATFGGSLKFDGKTKAAFASPVGDSNWARPAFKQHVEEQRYFADLDRLPANLLLKIWNTSTRFGTSIGRVALISGAINVAFSLAYYAIGACSPIAFKPSEHHTWLEFLALSLQRFLNSGTNIDGANLAVVYLLILNSFFGFATLGIFIAILSKKLVAAAR